MKKLEQYFRDSNNNGAIDHALRADSNQPQGVHFYIHPSGVNGDALDYIVVGDALIPFDGKGMNFGQAIAAMKTGKKVCREGWNGKDMWIVLMPELKLPPHSCQEPGAKVNDRTAKHIGEDTPLDSQPYIAMWTAQQKWQPGWNASQVDVLAEDWMIVL